MIITIGREHGSKGHEIAKKLADELGMKCYDKEIVDAAAADSELKKEIFASYDEKRVSSFLMSTPNYMGLGEGFRLNMQVAAEQFSAIRKLADEGNCIFVGRCANYILRNRDDVISVFIYAKDSFRIRTLQERFQLPEDKAKKLMKEVDKDRSSYYKYYTDQEWGDCSNYDLCIDSSRVGTDGAVEIIKAMVGQLQK